MQFVRLPALFLAIVVSSALTFSIAQDAPVIHKTSTLATVDVVVTRNGHPVKDLPQQVFHVFEDGQEQSIKIFEEHSVNGAPAKREQPAALPANTYTNVPETDPDTPINVILLDAVNTAAGDQSFARQRLVRYLQTIPPGAHIAVFTLASRLRLVQGLTSDPALLVAALNKIPLTQSSLLQVDAGQSAAEESPILPPASPIPSFSRIGAFDETIHNLNDFESEEIVHVLDQRVEITLDAMKQLALYLGALPGRKNLIWFSASFPLSLTPESAFDAFRAHRNYAGLLQQVSDLLTASRVAVYPVDTRGVQTVTPSAEKGVVTRNTSGRGVNGGYTLSIPNHPTEPTAEVIKANAEFETMVQLAKQTGGVPFYNGNFVDQEIAQALDNGSNYYTLAYSPATSKFDGKFRKIQVKLSGHDYHLEYRRGYFAEASNAHSSNALLKAGTGALDPGALPYAQILFRARVLPAGDPSALNLEPQSGPAGLLADQLKPPVKRYWIEFTADMHQVSAVPDVNGIYQAAIEFIAIAYDREGRPLNAVRRAFKLAIPPSQYEQILRTGYSARSDLDLPASDAYLRLAVHDISADRIGSLEVHLPGSRDQAATKTNMVGQCNGKN